MMLLIWDLADVRNAELSPPTPHTRPYAADDDVIQGDV